MKYSRPKSARGEAGRHGPAKRKCLRCEKKFPSKHAGNRLCRKCSEILKRSHSPLDPTVL